MQTDLLIALSVNTDLGPVQETGLVLVSVFRINPACLDLWSSLAVRKPVSIQIGETAPSKFSARPLAGVRFGHAKFSTLLQSCLETPAPRQVLCHQHPAVGESSLLEGKRCFQH